MVKTAKCRIAGRPDTDQHMFTDNECNSACCRSLFRAIRTQGTHNEQIIVFGGVEVRWMDIIERIPNMTLIYPHPQPRPSILVPDHFRSLNIQPVKYSLLIMGWRRPGQLRQLPCFETDNLQCVPPMTGDDVQRRVPVDADRPLW